MVVELSKGEDLKTAENDKVFIVASVKANSISQNHNSEPD